MVFPFDEFTEKLIEQRMNYLLTALIESKAAFSWIGDGPRFMNEHMVPRLVPVGLGLVELVPLLAGRALGVKRDHHAAVLITHMTNQIARRERGRRVVRQI